MTKYTSLPDPELVCLIKADNRSAFTEFYDRYKSPLYLQAFKMLGNDEEAKDVVQEMFIRIWETRHEINVRTTLEAYVYQSIRHKVIDFIRRRQTITRYLDSLESFLEQGMVTPDESYIEKETLALFRKEMARLPEKMREVFELSRTYGLSNREIAQKLGISENTVKKQINKSLKLIRRRINFSLFSMLFL